nr:hypothetical protein [Rhodococcus sp. 15-1154-1]
MSRLVVYKQPAMWKIGVVSDEISRLQLPRTFSLDLYLEGSTDQVDRREPTRLEPLGNVHLGLESVLGETVKDHITAKLRGSRGREPNPNAIRRAARLTGGAP